MHQPGKWWMGLIPVAAIWLAAGGYKTGAVENDLASRATEAIAKASPDTAGAMKVAVSGRDVILQGPEFASGQGDAIGQAVVQTTGVRLVDARFEKVPAAKPYVFSATRDGSSMTLSGAAPLPVLHDRLIEAAKTAMPGGEIIDKLTYATGAPDGFAPIAMYGLTEAAKLEGGAFSLSDKAYSVAGGAPSSAVFESAIAATQRLPEGATLAKADIQPPEAKPYAWSATSDGVATTIIGVAPSIEARSAILKAASASLPGKMIVDQMQVARGAPSGDYGASASYALGELGRLAKGRVSMSDGAYSISGEASTAQAYETALAKTKELPAGLTLARADILAPEAKPFNWGANNDGKSLTLTGMAPSAVIRGDIANAAAKLFPNKSIVNEMGIARGAPDGEFAKAATGALAELAKLATGKAGLLDAKLSISGEGPADVTNATVGASAKSALPAPFEVAAIDIKEMSISPYVFKLAKADGKVVLSGYAPDDKSKQDLIAAAKAAFFDDAVDDQLKTGKGAPANFVAALKGLFPALARLASGGVSLSDATMSIDGQAIYPKAAEQIKAALASGASGFKIATADIGVKPPGPALATNACQPAFEGLLEKGHVQFETGSATLSKQSQALLDHLIDVAQRCRDANVEVAGHTDSVGAAESNLELSKRRAQSVVDYISEAGVDTSRISSAGYGQDKPVASNDTPDGRAQNRRIEFLVK
jgi:OOP family OmpA-OmpF porin